MKRKTEHEVTIIWEEKPLLCTLVGNYFPPFSGRWGGGPDSWAGPEPSDLEILSLKRKDTGEELVALLADDDIDDLVNQIDDIEASLPDPDDERDNDLDFEDDAEFIDKRYRGVW